MGEGRLGFPEFQPAFPVMRHAGGFVNKHAFPLCKAGFRLAPSSRGVYPVFLWNARIAL
jgi:hypothetical protein